MQLSELPAEADELYTLPPSDFTAARNDLVKRLRAEKRRDEADAVKSLRRPSVPAWAINQVARGNPDRITDLFAAGAAVAAAQRRALSGVKESGLRDASSQRRERIDEVWKAAADVLRDAGVEPQPHRQAVAATLEAATADADVAELVRTGRLTTDAPAPSGFGDVFGLSVVPATDQPAGDAGHQDAADGEQQRTARARAAEALAVAKHEATQTARRATELRDRAADRRRAAVRAAAEAERLERRAAQARETADEQAAVADDLEADADAAERAARAAAEDVERLQADLEQNA